MKRAGAYLLIPATLAFIASTLAYALRPVPPQPELSGMSLIPDDLLMGGPVALMQLFLRPRTLAMVLLLGLTWSALSYHAMRRIQEGHRLRAAEVLARHTALTRRLQPGSLGPPDAGEMVEQHCEDASLAEHGLLIGGLLAGAIWPWLTKSMPLAAFGLAFVMLAGILGAALRGVRQGDQIQKSAPLGFVAGWATLVTFSHFIMLIHARLNAPLVLAASVGIALVAFATVSIQLRLGRNISFSVAVIWGLIGIAAGTVAINAALATMAVLAIAVIVVALVQVTT